MYFDTSIPGSLKRTVFTAIVTPRPIGWISTLGPDGQCNLAPFSFFNLVSSAPPILMFSGNAPHDRQEKDTIANARLHREFVYNLATAPLAQQMVKSSTPAPYGVDEFELVGLEKAPSRKVRPPRVALSPVTMECEVEDIIDVRPRYPGETTSTIVLGRVVALHIDDALMDANGRFDTLAARPLARLGGMQYSELGRILEIAQPFVKAGV